MNDLLNRKPLFDSYLKRSCLSSAFSFVNVFAWSDFFRFEFVEFNGCLGVFAHQDVGCFQYLPPLGDVTEDAIAACFDHMQKINKGSSLTRVENVPHAMLGMFDPKRYVGEARSHEYCYYRKDIAEMKGPAFASPRWLWNHFRKQHDYVFEPYRPSDADECHDLYRRWAQKRLTQGDEIYQEMIRENETVHKRVLGAAASLDVIGRVLRINGAVAGYTFGYAVSDKVFCDLFEITDVSFKGISSVIFRELCRDPQVAAYDFINVMDDFSMPNLQQTKMHFQPRFLWPSYTVSLR